MPVSWQGTEDDDVIIGVIDDINFIKGLGGDDYLVGGDYQDPAELAFQGAGADLISGGDGNDEIHGRGGNDNLRGDAGDDLLHGEDGDDLLRGGAGVDRFFGGAGADRVSLYSLDATQGAWVDLRYQLVLNDGFGNTEQLVSIEGAGQGTAFADTFIGDNGANVIGGEFGDLLYGRGGDDSFFVGSAPGLIDGGAGVDEIQSFARSALVADTDGDGLAEVITTGNGVIVDLAEDAIIDDGFGNSGVLKSIENLGGSLNDDWLAGDSKANVLKGSLGDDTLLGRGGNDVLIGGEGADRLEGGKGNDRFVYGSALDSPAGGAGDVILDFESSRDRIDLGGLGDEVAGGGPLVLAGAFSGLAGQIVLSAAGAGQYALAADLDGDMIADFSIMVQSAAPILPGDLIL